MYQKNIYQKKKEVVHQQFACDICECCPIKGIRYRCTVCNDYDECERCHKNTQHEHPFKAIKKEVPNFMVSNNPNLIHKKSTCNNCKKCPIVGVKFRYDQLPTSELCSNCYQLMNHTSNATYTPIDFVEDSLPKTWKKCGRQIKNYKYLMIARPFGMSEIQPQYYSVPLKNIEIKASINNSIAKTELNQEFVNDSEEMLEAEYIFPVSTTACFDSFTVEYKNNIIKGIIKEKQEAQAEYKENLEKGNVVAYSEINPISPDIMKIMIGNIPPETSIKISYHYLEELEISCNKFYKYSVPATITPRYLNKSSQQANEEDELDLSNISTINPQSNQVYTLEISLNIESVSKITYFKSPSHKLNILEENKETNLLRIKVLESLESKYLKPNETFTFLYTNENIAQPSIIVSKSSKCSQLCAQITFIPNFANATMDDAFRQQYETQKGYNFEVDLDHAQAEFIFIIDRSGSMRGSRINKAKEALQLFLASLPPNCYFNICSFGSTYTFMFSESAKYDEQILEKAINEIQNYQADYGGTQIYQPLNDIFNKPCIKNYPRQIFLLTDGSITNLEQTLKLINNNNSRQRVNTIGIGNGCSECLIKEGANCGNGNYIFIQDSDNVQGKIISILDKSLTPFLDNFIFEYDANLIESIIPAPLNIPFIQKNEKFIMHIFFKEQLEEVNTSFTLKCFDSTIQQEISYSMQISSDKCSLCSDIFKLGMHKEIKFLENYINYQMNEPNCDIFIQKKSNITDEIIALSLKHQIISTLTSFICLVDQSDEQNQTWKSKNSNKLIVPQILSIDQSLMIKYDSSSIGMIQPCSYINSNSRGRGGFQNAKFNRCIPQKFKKNKKEEFKCYKSSAIEFEPCKTLQPQQNIQHLTRDKKGQSTYKPIASSGETNLMTVLKQVKPLGYWQLSSELLKILKIKKDALESLITEAEASILKESKEQFLMTIAIYGWLEKHQNSEIEQWILIERKVVSWLKNQKIDNWQEIKAKIIELL